MEDAEAGNGIAIRKSVGNDQIEVISQKTEFNSARI